MAAKASRSNNSLSMSCLVSSVMGFQAGFSTNCRRHALQANLAFPLWICPFRTTKLDPQLGHVGRFCSFAIPSLYNHYPFSTIHKFMLSRNKWTACCIGNMEIVGEQVGILHDWSICNVFFRANDFIEADLLKSGGQHCRTIPDCLDCFVTPSGPPNTPGRVIAKRAHHPHPC